MGIFDEAASSKVESKFQSKKILVTGFEGQGKTSFILSCPRPLLILDTQNGTDDFKLRPDIDEFKVIKVSSYYTLVEKLEAIKKEADAAARKGQQIGATIAVDSISNIYMQLVEEHAVTEKFYKSGKPRDDFGIPDKTGWFKIKIKWARLTTLLSNIPNMNVIVTGENKINSDGEVDQVFDDAFKYFPDIAFQLKRNGKNVSATVTKQSRSGVLLEGQEISAVSFDKIIKLEKEGLGKLATTKPAQVKEVKKIQSEVTAMAEELRAGGLEFSSERVGSLTLPVIRTDENGQNVYENDTGDEISVASATKVWLKKIEKEIDDLDDWKRINNGSKTYWSENKWSEESRLDALGEALKAKYNEFKKQPAA